MATIDKPLPNTKTTSMFRSRDRRSNQRKSRRVETKGGPVEIEMTEEGGAKFLLILL